MQNKGFEFELGYRNNIGDFSYNVNGNLATLHNEVTYLNPDLNQLNGAQVTGKFHRFRKRGTDMVFLWL